MIWDILTACKDDLGHIFWCLNGPFLMFKVYPNSILKPLFLQTEAVNLTTEDTLAPFSATIPANWKPAGSQLRALHSM
jgi:hypothetical protein